MYNSQKHWAKVQTLESSVYNITVSTWTNTRFEWLVTRVVRVWHHSFDMNKCTIRKVSDQTGTCTVYQSFDMKKKMHDSNGWWPEWSVYDITVSPCTNARLEWLVSRVVSVRHHSLLVDLDGFPTSWSGVYYNHSTVEFGRYCLKHTETLTKYEIHEWRQHDCTRNCQERM